MNRISHRFFYVVFLLLGIGIGKVHTTTEESVKVEFVHYPNLNKECTTTLKAEQATSNGNEACVFVNCAQVPNGILTTRRSFLTIVAQEELRKIK